MSVVKLFPEHKVFENFKIDKVLVDFEGIGVVNIASNDVRKFYVVCDSLINNEMVSIRWAVIPISEKYHAEILEDSVKGQDVNAIYNIIFNNFEDIIYASKYFEEEDRDTVEYLSDVGTKSESSYPFLKFYRFLKEEKDSVEK